MANASLGQFRRLSVPSGALVYSSARSAQSECSTCTLLMHIVHARRDDAADKATAYHEAEPVTTPRQLHPHRMQREDSTAGNEFHGAASEGMSSYRAILNQLAFLYFSRNRPDQTPSSISQCFFHGTQAQLPQKLYPLLTKPSGCITKATSGLHRVTLNGLDLDQPWRLDKQWTGRAKISLLSCSSCFL